MTHEFITIILIGLATHRITRLITQDRIAENARLRLQVALEERKERKTGIIAEGQWQSGWAYMISCPWCSGVYIAMAVTAATDAVTSVPLPALTIAAASTVTGLLTQRTQ